MAYVTIPKDLSRIQSKVLFRLTKRQVICFGAAALCMILVMLPFFLFAMYEKNGQPFEVYGRHIIESCFIRPKERPYQTNNLYEALIRQNQMEMEVKAIVQNSKARREGKRGGKAQAHPQGKKRD